MALMAKCAWFRVLGIDNVLFIIPRTWVRTSVKSNVAVYSLSLYLIKKISLLCIIVSES